MVALLIGLQFEVNKPSSVLKSDTAVSATLSVSATVRGALPRTLTRTSLMMDSPPQLSPPPELKSSLDQSELVVRQLTREHLVLITQRRFIPRGLGPAIEGNRENGEHAV